MPVDPSRPQLARLLGHPLALALAAAATPLRVWLVGGAVRDAALGFPLGPDRTPDLDAVVERDAALVADRLARELPARRVRLGGDRFAAERLIATTGTLDLWDLGDGSLADDLARRDFTVNALALDSGGELVDLHGGLEDLGTRLLRATRPSVFEEDPARVLRLARFAVTLPGFRVEPETARLAQESAGALRGVAGERIRDELAKTWAGSALAPVQDALEHSGAWPTIWLPTAVEEPVEGPTAVPVARVADDRLESAGEARGSTAASIAIGHALAVRIAAGRERARPAIEQLAAGAILSRAERRSALLLLSLADEEPPADESALRWFLHRAGRLGPQALALAGALADPWESAGWNRAALRGGELLDLRGAQILEPKPLLSGDEIAAALGLEPGPELGRAVRELRELQIRGEVSDRTEALVRLGRRRG